MKRISALLELFVLVIVFIGCTSDQKTDRYSLVSRQNIKNTVFDSLAPLSVGNGRFVYTMDMTGLQTFPQFYSHGISLITMPYWSKGNQSPYGVGLIGLLIFKENGKEISISDISDPVQQLNLWTGEIDSKFRADGVPVHLKTVCHPDYDMISVRIVSDLLEKNRFKIKIGFPHDGSFTNGYDSDISVKHKARFIVDTLNLFIFHRKLNDYKYDVLIWPNAAKMEEITPNLYYLQPDPQDSVYSFSCQFMNDRADGRVQNFGETETASRKSWMKFWNSIDITEINKKATPHSKAIEENIIFSRYKLRIKSGR
jgi:hypothetical protein